MIFTIFQSSLPALSNGRTNNLSMVLFYEGPLTRRRCQMREHKAVTSGVYRNVPDMSARSEWGMFKVKT